MIQLAIRRNLALDMINTRRARHVTELALVRDGK